MTIGNLQLAVIGAVQRASPPTAALFLEWTGIPDASLCVFNIAGDERSGAMTSIEVGTGAADIELTKSVLADYLGLDDADENRRSSVIKLFADSPAHRIFWTRALKHDAEEMKSPLEFWWLLSIVRHGGPLRASTMLLSTLGVKATRSVFVGAVAEINNPSFSPAARDLRSALKGKRGYEAPKSLDFYLQVPVDSQAERDKGLLSIPLDSDDVRDRVASALIQLALEDEEEV